MPAFPVYRLLVVLALLLGVAGTLRLGFDGDLRAIFLFDDDAISAYQRLHQSFPDVESDVSLVIAGQPFSPSALNAVRKLESGLLEIDDVEQTISIFNLPAVEELLLDPRNLEPVTEIDHALAERIQRVSNNSPQLPRFFTGDNGQVQRLIIQLNTAVLEDTGRLVEIRNAIEQTATEVLGDESGFYLSGFAILKPALREHIVSDLRVFIVIGVSLAFALSVLLFRQLRIALIMGAGPLTGVLWTLGLMGWIGQPISIFSSVLPPLLFVIGYANAAHIVFSIRQLVSRGYMNPGLGWQGMRRVHRACFVSALTTGIGFVSLYFVASKPVAEFGLFAGIGNMLTYLAVVLITPALCEAFYKPETNLDERGSHAGLSQRFIGLYQFTSDNRKWVVGVGVACSLVFVGLALQAKPDYRFRENFSSGNRFYQAVEINDREFGGAFSLNVISEWAEDIEFSMPRYLALQKQLEALANRVFQSQRAIGLATLMPAEFASLPTEVRDLDPFVEGDILPRFLDSSKRRGLLIVPIRDRGSKVLLAEIAEFKASAGKLLEQYPGYRIDVTGLAYLALQGGAQVIDDIARSLGFAVCAIFAVISIALGSIRAGAICMLPNILPVAGVGAILVLAGMPLQYTSVLVFAICLGVAVDDSVHLTMRVNKLGNKQIVPGEQSGGQVIATALSQVGPAMVFSTLVTIAGFCALIFSDTGSVASIGYLSVYALLLALVADLVLLPALLIWWRWSDNPGQDRSL